MVVVVVVTGVVEEEEEGGRGRGWRGAGVVEESVLLRRGWEDVGSENRRIPRTGLAGVFRDRGEGRDAVSRKGVWKGCRAGAVEGLAPPPLALGPAVRSMD